MPLYRYSRWDGSQEHIAIDGDVLMENFSEKFVASGDVTETIKSLTQRGIQLQNIPGVQEMVQRIQNYRKELLNRYDISSPLDDVKQRLDEIIDIERSGIEQRLNGVKQRNRQSTVLDLPAEVANQLGDIHKRMSMQNLSLIDQLPDNAAYAIQRLNSYDFMDDEARSKFGDLIKFLQKTVLDSYRKDLVQHIQHIGMQDDSDLKKMLQDLNGLISGKLQGDQSSFQGFLDKHDSILSQELPQSLDELIEQVQAQINHMGALLKSMNPAQRRELEEIFKSVFDDEGLQAQLTQLAFGLDQVNPLNSLGREYKFEGDDLLTLDEATDLMDLLQDMEELEKQLKRTQRNGKLSEVCLSIMQSVFGSEMLQSFQQLMNLTDVLESAEYIRNIGSRHELTSKGIRKIGQHSLQEIFSQLKNKRTGEHRTHYGSGNSYTYDETKRYEYGDKFDLHLNRTLLNTIQRRGGEVPLKIHAEDFEIYRNDHLAKSNTVLMLDLSLSMVVRGNFLAAKKVTLALDNLIRNQFPRDSLYVVGFSTYAREFKPKELPYLSWDGFAPYTNMQHGLVVAQQLLSRTGGAKQIILISDGEPTAHIEDKQLFVQSPPSPQTMRETLLEVKKCTRRSIRINTFMLDQTPQLVDFVEQISRINRGRVFYTNPDLLGQYILIDYLSNRKEVIS
jgi:uncharacterized protein with von Willebrand factor type A (vWA) domain